MKEVIFMIKMKHLVDYGLENYKLLLEEGNKDEILKMNNDEFKKYSIQFIENKIGIVIDKVIESGAYKLTELKLKMFNDYVKNMDIKLHKITKEDNDGLKIIVFNYKHKNKEEKATIDVKKIFIPMSRAEEYMFYLFVGD